MKNVGNLSRILYLLVYSGALLNTVSTLVFRKKLLARSRRPLLLLFLALALCSVVISLQVFLDVTGLLERLSETGSSQAVLLINMVIISMVAVITYAAVASSFSFRPAPLAKQTAGITAIVSAAALLPLLLLQISMLFSYSVLASEILGYLMIAGAALYFTGTVFAAVRMFVPFRISKSSPSETQLRVLLVSLVLLPLLILISGSTSGALAAPAGFTILNVLCILTLFNLIREAETADWEPEVSDEPDIHAICRELGLSRRETEVALKLASGQSYKEIGAELFISMSTTQTHVGRIYSKLGINSKTELSNLLYHSEKREYYKK